MSTRGDALLHEGQHRSDERDSSRITPGELGPVLVVDDDHDIREVIEIALDTHGYHVETAASGAECLRFLRGTERPSLILLDMMMPCMSGWEVCERLARDPVLSTIPVVVLTGGNVSPEACPKARTVLRKPIQLAELLEVIERHAAQPAGASHG